MDDLNPYAPSRASLSATGPISMDDAAPSVWRDGDVLIKSMDAAMPARCVKCNGPADPPTKNRKIYWHHPALYLLILFNIIIYAIVATIVRKKAFVDAGLCKDHKKRRRLAITLAWAGSLGGIVLMFMGLGSSLGIWGAFVGLLVILGSIIGALIFARIVYPKGIDKTYVRLKGCGSAFLDSLPPFNAI